jgi:hypothetical protein
MGNFSARPNISLNLTISKSDDSSRNRSTISWTLKLVENASQPTYSTDPTNTASLSFSLPSGTSLVSGDRTPAIAKYGYDFRATGLQSKTIGSGSFVVQHDASGVGGTITGSASANANILGSATDNTNQSLTNYTRLPSAPSAAPTLSKSGKVLTITSATSPALDPVGPALSDYVFQYSTNGGTTWSAAVSMGTDATIAWTATVFPATYLIRTAAVSSEGTGAYSATSSIFLSAYGYRFALVGGVPTSTAITTAARYTGVVTDTIVVGGTTYTNWKQIDNVKRYVANTGSGSPGWIDLVQ